MCKKLHPGLEDIKCYKVLVVTPIGLRSPIFDNGMWEVGRLYVDPKRKEIPIVFSAAYGATIIEGGAFHTFKTEEAAKDAIREWSGKNHSRRAYVIVECSIPADTMFVYEGIVPLFECNLPGYASDSLRLEKIL